MFDLDFFVEETKLCKYLSENNLRQLCRIVCDILIEEPNVQNVQTPVTVCGDIHGQYYDLEELFKKSGQIPDEKYIFLGDFVDRGYYSLETVTKLLVLKAKWPNKIVLLRGNHESRQTTRIYGFYDECLTKYGNSNAWKFITNLFDYLPIAAVIDNRILCIHGGLSPSIATIDQIRTIKRVQEIPQKGPFCDLVWSDPNDPCGFGEGADDDDNELPFLEDNNFGGKLMSSSANSQNWAVSSRGAGWLFGKNVTLEFVRTNNLSLICRAHQLVNEGYKYIFDNTLVTIWSAPNYCYRCGNKAAVIKFAEDGSQTPLIFEAVPDKDRDIPKQKAFQYFL